ACLVSAPNAVAVSPAPVTRTSTTAAAAPPNSYAATPVAASAAMAPVAAMTTATVAAASATVATTVPAAVTTTVATVAAALHEFNVRGCRLLFVEDIKGCQANVGDFLFAKEFVHVPDCRRWQSGRGFAADYRCATGQRQRGSDQRYRARPVSLGSWL